MDLKYAEAQWLKCNLGNLDKQPFTYYLLQFIGMQPCFSFKLPQSIFYHIRPYTAANDSPSRTPEHVKGK